jgi:hypothetical protein
MADEGRGGVVDHNLALGPGSGPEISKRDRTGFLALRVPEGVGRRDLLAGHPSLHLVSRCENGVGETTDRRAVEATMNEDHLDRRVLLKQRVELQGRRSVAEGAGLVIGGHHFDGAGTYALEEAW